MLSTLHDIASNFDDFNCPCHTFPVNFTRLCQTFVYLNEKCFIDLEKLYGIFVFEVNMMIWKSYGIFRKCNGNTRFRHFDLLEMAWHLPQTSIVTLLQLLFILLWVEHAIYNVRNSRHTIDSYIVNLWKVCVYSIIRYWHQVKFATRSWITIWAPKTKWQKGVTQGAISCHFDIPTNVCFIWIIHVYVTFRTRYFLLLLNMIIQMKQIFDIISNDTKGHDTLSRTVL